MSRRFRNLLLLTIVFIPLLLAASFLLLPARNSRILSKKIKKLEKPEVAVSARVGHYRISILSGWSSPFSEITLSSGNLFRKTSADERGFFVFYSIPIENRNLCLIAQDVNLLPSFPLCLAPLPQTEDIEVENILLSPTLSLEGERIPIGKTTKASGMTFPNSEVDIYLFTNPRPSFWFRIIKTAYAMGLPKYKIKSNANGYFEFSLPAVNTSTDRVFASASLPNTLVPNLTDPRSPKSNTLSFRAIGIFDILSALFASLFAIKIRLSLNWTLIIILEIIIIILIIIFSRRKRKCPVGADPCVRPRPSDLKRSN